MSVGGAIKHGFAMAGRMRSVVWALLLINLGLAAGAALPIYEGMLHFTGHSLMSETLAHGFSTDWLTDFSFNNPGLLQRYGAIIEWLGLVSLPVNALLAGGVLARFRTPEQGYSLGDFFRNVGRYASRMFWLMVVGLVGYWIAFRLLNQGLGDLIDKWTRDWLDDRPVFWLQLGAGILLLVAVGFMNVVMDYARVHIVMKDDSGVIQSFLASLGFSLGRFGRAVTAWALPSLGGLALLGIYLLVAPWAGSLLGRTAHGRVLPQLMVALLFVGQQAVIWGRYWFRVATWASEWSAFGSSKIEAGN
ncbi:MAG: hypothetical protein DMG24_17860 [Acidobacteria bacterium]|nr:MAG: hypothetical protein DMG24_17860 [Acidobacteriota bacterium]